MINNQTKNIMKIKITIIVAILLGLTGVYILSKQGDNQPKTTAPNLVQEESTSENATYGHVHALFVNPTDSSLLLGTHEGIFKSTDGGKTFKKVDTKGDVKTMDFMNFAYDQSNKIIFAGGHDLGVIKSTDDGVTWTKTDSGIKGSDIHALAISPLDNTRLFAFSVGSGVFGTKDGAKSWYRVDDGPDNPSTRAFGYMGTPSGMDRSMQTDKTTNIGYLWAGTGGGLYSSFACFCGWTKTTGISDNTTIYTLAPNPVNRSSMFAGTKDGIFKTADEGKSFTQINSDIKNVAAIAFDEANSKVIYTATSNGSIYKSDDEGKTWNKVNE